jgi:hypothetical protein
MLSEVKRIVEEGHLGVRTYEKFVQACLQRAAEGDSEAVTHFVFGKLVQPFVDYYADQALSEARAIRFRNNLLSALNDYEQAETPEARQEVLREAIRKMLADNFED